MYVFIKLLKIVYRIIEFNVQQVTKLTMSRQGRRNYSVGDKSSVSRAKPGRVTRSFNQVTEAELGQVKSCEVATR